MTDEEYVYRQDIREKSITARSAKKAYSARRRGCKLSTDGLSEKELNKLNGPIYSVQLGKPMDWEEFKGLLPSLQKQYIDDILSKYKVGPEAIARALGISGPHCGRYLKGKLGYSFTGRTTQKETMRFLTDFQIEMAPEVKGKTEESELALDRVALTFTGPFDPSVITTKLSGLFATGQRVSVAIEVAKVAEN